MSRPSFRQLEAFVAVAEHGSSSAAAAATYQSQSAVSDAVAGLERNWQTRLFIRRPGRPLELTAAGRRLLGPARALLRGADEIDVQARAGSEHAVGVVRLGVFASMSPFVLPHILGSARTHAPDVRVEVLEGDLAGLQAELLAGRIDIAMLYDLGLDPAISGTRLWPTPPYALVAADHPAATAGAVRIADLAAEPLVLLDLPHSREYFRSVFDAARIVPRVRYRVSTFETVRSLVGAGEGWAVLNQRSDLHGTHAGGSVRAVPFVENLPPLEVAVAWPESAQLTAAVAALINAIEQLVTEDRGDQPIG